MYHQNNMLKKSVLVVSAVIVGGIIAYAYRPNPTALHAQDNFYIYAFNDDERDIKDIEETFQDDFYWLTTRDTYDVRAMLKYRTSEFSDPSLYNNMFIYVMRQKATDVFIGFMSFFKASFYKGQILFVSVNKAFRGKGYGQKLTEYALQQMKNMGMIKATLFTRTDNKAARRLYERMGFKLASFVGNFGVYYDMYLN